MICFKIATVLLTSGALFFTSCGNQTEEDTFLDYLEDRQVDVSNLNVVMVSNGNGCAGCNNMVVQHYSTLMRGCDGTFLVSAPFDTYRPVTKVHIRELCDMNRMLVDEDGEVAELNVGFSSPFAFVKRGEDWHFIELLPENVDSVCASLAQQYCTRQQ